VVLPLHVNWENPIAGTTKVNADASFILGNGLDNEKGKILSLDVRMLVKCEIYSYDNQSFT
jgi:hypothetical protein